MKFLSSVTLFEVLVVWSMGLITLSVWRRDVAMTVALLGHLGVSLIARVKGQV